MLLLDIKLISDDDWRNNNSTKNVYFKGYFFKRFLYVFCCFSNNYGNNLENREFSRLLQSNLATHITFCRYIVCLKFISVYFTFLCWELPYFPYVLKGIHFADRIVPIQGLFSAIALIYRD